MRSDVLEVFSEQGIVSINVNDIPNIITSSIDNISKLEGQVRSAEQSASKAMDYVGSQMTRYEEKGKWVFKHRSGNTKDIIEDTQEAVEKLATAQQVSVEAIKKSFEFQKKLAQTAKYLFQLGCANITVNRITVRAIELQLSGASKETLTELAKQEMMAVVKQLKEQEDILKKQEFLNSKVKEHALRLDTKDDLDRDQSKKIELLDSAHKVHHEKISEISDSLSIKSRIDAEQTHRIEELVALLKSKDATDSKQEIAISDNRTLTEKNAEAIRILIEYTKQKDILDKEQSNEIASLKKAFSKNAFVIGLVFSVFAIIIGIVSIIMQILK